VPADVAQLVAELTAKNPAARAHRGQAGDGGGGEPPPCLGRVQVQMPSPVSSA